VYSDISRKETVRILFRSSAHDNHNHSCLDYSLNLIMNPRGAQCRDELTDRRVQGN